MRPSTSSMAVSLDAPRTLSPLAAQPADNAKRPMENSKVCKQMKKKKISDVDFYVVVGSFLAFCGSLL